MAQCYLPEDYPMMAFFWLREGSVLSGQSVSVDCIALPEQKVDSRFVGLVEMPSIKQSNTTGLSWCPESPGSLATESPELPEAPDHLRLEWF